MKNFKYVLFALYFSSQSIIEAQPRVTPDPAIYDYICKNNEGGSSSGKIISPSHSQAMNMANQVCAYHGGLLRLDEVPKTGGATGSN